MFLVGEFEKTLVSVQSAYPPSVEKMEGRWNTPHDTVRA